MPCPLRVALSRVCTTTLYIMRTHPQRGSVPGARCTSTAKVEPHVGVAHSTDHAAPRRRGQGLFTRAHTHTSVVTQASGGRAPEPLRTSTPREIPSTTSPTARGRPANPHTRDREPQTPRPSRNRTRHALEMDLSPPSLLLLRLQTHTRKSHSWLLAARAPRAARHLFLALASRARYSMGVAAISTKRIASMPRNSQSAGGGTTSGSASSTASTAARM